MPPYLPLPPHQSGKELDFIHDAFAHNWIAPLGPNVDGFEQDLASFLGRIPTSQPLVPALPPCISP